MNLNKYTLVLILLSIIVVASYIKLPFIFFQQDEILVFGLMIFQGWSFVTRGFDGTSVHVTPLLNLLYLFLFKLFGLNHTLYNTLGVGLHLLNAYLLSLISFKLLNNKLYAWVTGILFLSLSSSIQLVTWPLVSVSLLSFSTSLIAVVYFLNCKSLSTKKIFVVSLLILISVFISDYTISTFLIFTLLFLIKRERMINIRSIGIYVPFLLSMLGYSLVRIISILSYDKNNSDVSKFYSINNLLDLVSLPVRYVGQLFIPQEILLTISTFVSDELKIRKNIYLDSEIGAFKVVSSLVGLTGIILYLFIIQKTSDNLLKKYFYVNIIILLIVTIPFLIVSDTLGGFAIIPPRYLYAGQIVFSILAILIFSSLRFTRLWIKVCVLTYFVFLILSGLYINLLSFEKLYTEGIIRKSIIEKIVSTHPILPSKVIFYMESDKSYFGLPPEERILPFQSGFGQTLLIWYYQLQKFPIAYFENKYLWEITSQGYKEIDGKGFGFYRDFNLLASTVNANQLPLNSIISFRYDSKAQQLSDNSEEIKGRLLGYNSKKRIVNLSHNSYLVSENEEEFKYAIDGNNETFWKSLTPYVNRQNILITLLEQAQIAQIVIDTYNNKDQDQVGFIVYTSNDKDTWSKIYESKRNPPDKNGMINIYIEPVPANYIKIEQIGGHQYAPWVIHEISLYEKTL